MTNETTLLSYQQVDEWEPQPPEALIYDDGEPLESNRHRIAMNVLIDSALEAFKGNPNVFVGGNMFVYYSRYQRMNQDFRGPDFFAVLDIDGNRERKAWVVWEEAGRYPDVIIELMSPTTANVDLEDKKDLYERTFHTSEYFVFDPFDANSLQGWRLQSDRRYQALTPDSRSWLWCDTLGLWLGTWEGRIQREPAQGTCPWLRFYNREGNLILLPNEIAEQERQIAEQERQRADRLAVRLRELGEDPNQL